MPRERENELSQLLLRAAEALDMPEHLYKEATRQYKEVGQFLGAPDSPLNTTFLEIYLQGSARIGTLNRPDTDKDEYDFDCVSYLQLKKESVTQKELKQRIGDRLKQNDFYRRILTEGRRCWTLNFDGRLYLDILPAIPDEEGRKDSILVTDRKLVQWQHSDPKGYAEWFLNRMPLQLFADERETLAKALQVEIEEVPEWKVKTALQRAVQLLKRHRDLHFINDREDQPISIIITTLAAVAYTGQANLFDALVGIVRKMRDYIEVRDGVYWVANPMNPAENFADKWQEYPRRREKFYAWVEKVETDVLAALQTNGIPGLTAALAPSFGESVMAKAVEGWGNSLYRQRETGKLRMATGTGVLGIVGATAVKGHTFHGDTD